MNITDLQTSHFSGWVFHLPSKILVKNSVSVLNGEELSCCRDPAITSFLD